MDSTNETELNVTFYPELYLQRRVWILNFLRKHGIARVLDVGCGEGALLNTLCQPAPWLTPPPTTVLPASPTSFLFSCSPSRSISEGPSSPAYTYKDDDIPNLHVREVHGLDISDEDLVFAMQAASPPERKEEDTSEAGSRMRSLTGGQERWEALMSKVWKGSLEVINDEFRNIECIVGMEVIEHLPENTFKAFGPVLLGVYHPEYLLVTTPSYTFNARFTSPDAPSSARTGSRDPTGRTDRIFRHKDHKFEWTREEFQTWCQKTAEEWGYEVNETTIGHAVEPDPWGRDDELHGATQVAAFYRVDRLSSNQEREEKARRVLETLDIESESHECLAAYYHPAEPGAMQPKPLENIARKVKEKMEDYRLAFMRMEELWFEPGIGSMCGGWIEVLVRAVEESADLNLKRDVDGVRKGRSMWSVELAGATSSPWDSESESIDDDIPEDWIPGETPYSLTFEGEVKEDDELELSTGEDGDVSGGEDDDEWPSERPRGRGTLTAPKVGAAWGQAEEGWNRRVPFSAMSSTGGWDGDESEDTS